MKPAVLYTHDLEPITVVTIPMWLWDRLEKGDAIRLAVMEAPKLTPSYGVPMTAQMKTVTIFAEMLVRRGKRHMMLSTQDEETALLLKADFLPGQRQELRHRERGAFAKGFLQAFAALANKGDL